MLYIIRKKKSEYLDYILQPLIDKGVAKAIPFDDRKGGLAGRLLRDAAWACAPGSLSQALLKAALPKDFRQQLQQIKADDKVLLFDIWNLKWQQAIRQALGRDVVDTFIWDSVSAFYKRQGPDPRYVDALGRLGLRIHTFDPDDARLYGMQLMPQVYRKAGIIGSTAADHLILRGNGAQASERQTTAQEGQTNSQKGQGTQTPQAKEVLPAVFYAGRCAGRTRELAMLVNQLKSESIQHSVFILYGKDTPKTVEGELARYFITTPLPYAEILAMAEKNQCIAEIVKPGQKGFTLRTLEALFMDKKLITNNDSIVDAPFYNPANIYILGQDKRTIAQFMAEPMQPVSDELKRPYDIEHWITKFLK